MTAITTYNADIYDVMFPGSARGDIDWYVQKAVAAGGPVLELGAGTGRITIPIAERGIRVAALDVSPGMLARLAEKAGGLPAQTRALISIHEADMTSFSLGDTFALVIIPFRAFLHNQTTEGQLAALACAHAHLRPGGELAFNVFHPSLEYMAARAGDHAGTWRWGGCRETADGSFTVYSESSRYDTVGQRIESLIKTEEFNAEGGLVRTHVLRLDLAYLYPSDIARLLDKSGFELVRLSGDFNGRPFERDGDELVVEARKTE